MATGAIHRFGSISFNCSIYFTLHCIDGAKKENQFGPVNWKFRGWSICIA